VTIVSIVQMRIRTGNSSLGNGSTMEQALCQSWVTAGVIKKHKRVRVGA
jgi:hypothetical protein